MSNMYDVYVPQVKPIDLDEIYNARMKRDQQQMLMEEMQDKRATRNQLKATLGGMGDMTPDSLLQAGRSIMGINPDEGIKLINAAASLATHQQQAKASGLNQNLKKMEFAAHLLDGVTDPQSYAAAMQTWQQATGEAPPADLAAGYDPVVVARYKGLVRSAAEREMDGLRKKQIEASMTHSQNADDRAAQLAPLQRDAAQQTVDAGRAQYSSVQKETDEMGMPTGRFVAFDKKRNAMVPLPVMEPGAQQGQAGPGGTQVQVSPPSAPAAPQAPDTPSVQASPQGGLYGTQGSTMPNSGGGLNFTPDMSVINQPPRAKGGHLNTLRAQVKSCGGRADGGATSEYNYTPKYEDQHNEFRTGDVLYDGTDTIHGSDGTTTTPGLLAAAYKTNPNDIPSSFSGYKGKYYGDADTTQASTDSTSSDALKTVQDGNSPFGNASFDANQAQNLGGNNALNMTVVGEKGPEVVLTPQGSDGYVLPITDKHASELLNWGVAGRADGGGTGGGGSDHDSDGGDGGDGGGDSGSDTGGVDNGGDGSGDRGMDAGSLGGEDRGGTGSDSDGSDYGGHGFESAGGGRDRSSGMEGGGFTPSEQGPYGAKFQAAFRGVYDPARYGSLSTAESVESMDPTARAEYVGNLDALDQSPNADLAPDNTPQSKAPSMFSNALAKQITDGVNLNATIDKGMQAYGLPTSTENTAQQQAIKDWSRYNLTDFAGATPANKIDKDYFGAYTNNNALASTALGIADQMNAEGYDMDGFGITSLNNGVHAKNSKHYTGDAIDVNSKVNSKSYGEFSSRMANAGYSRGDSLGFGKGEAHHWQ